MPGSIETYFRQYRNTRAGFEQFHNEVINMPRPDFQNMGLEILQCLASYLLLLEGKTRTTGNNYKEIMGLIREELAVGHFPAHRNIELERVYFVFEDLEQHYEQVGRMFRHYMGLCAFWGLISSISRQNKKVQFSHCTDFITVERSHLTDFIRNLGLSVNIRTNDFIKHLQGIPTIQTDADFQPTVAILKYMQEIQRPVSDFEISVLLGRIDALQRNDLILQRALDVGRSFSVSTREGQQQEFFRAMNWVNEDGSLFSYTSSQEPWFKFRTYLLFLKDFGLITQNIQTGLYSATSEGLSLLSDIPANVLDLNRLIAKLETEDSDMSARTIKDLLLRINMDTLQHLVSDEQLIKKFNQYSLTHPIIHRGKKIRNQFIAELARIRERYLCQAGSVTFERPDGRNYVEAHHIIEFSKGGPDILENLLVLGPTPHAQIHRGSETAKADMYTHLMSRGAIRFELFKKMVVEYNALSSQHLDLLLSNHLISASQKNELMNLLNS